MYQVEPSMLHLNVPSWAKYVTSKFTKLKRQVGEIGRVVKFPGGELAGGELAGGEMTGGEMEGSEMAGGQ